MSGVYSVSVAEETFSEEAVKNYLDELYESVPKGAPATDFASPPSGLYVGDAKHARLAVQAVTSGLRGNKALDRNKPGVKGKIASAIRKFYSGNQEKYYLTWLNTGKKPASKPASELHEMMLTPAWTVDQEARFPEVPTNPRVNIQALMAANGDPGPGVFVTRPLAILGDISENGLEYNQAIVSGVYTQVMAKAVPARIGHVSSEGKSSDFPPDAGYWVGATMDDTVFGKPTVFGKCYIPPGELRRMVLSRSATGTPLSNSLYGDITTADGEPVAVKIETIDFVPAERAALQTLGGDFVVTSEMVDDPSLDADGDFDGDKPEDVNMGGTMDEAALREAIQGMGPDKLSEMLHEMGHGHHIAEAHMKEAKCAECTPAAIREMLTSEERQHVAEMHMKEEATPQETYDMLPAEKRQSVAESYCKEMGQKMVAKEAKLLDEGKMAEMQQAISDLQGINKAHERVEFDRTLASTIDSYFTDWQVRTASGQEKLSALKRNFRVLTVAEMAGSTDVNAIKEAADKAWADVKPLAETTQASLAGPNVTVSVNGAGPNRFGVGADGRYEDDFVRKAVSMSNSLGGRSDGGSK